MTGGCPSQEIGGQCPPCNGLPWGDISRVAIADKADGAGHARRARWPTSSAPDDSSGRHRTAVHARSKFADVLDAGVACGGAGFDHTAHLIGGLVVGRLHFDHISVARTVAG